MDLDERDKIITQGVWAEGLQSDPIFQEVIADEYELTFAKMMMTESKASDEREALYWMIRGIRQFEDALDSLSSAKKMIGKEEAGHGQ